MSEMPDGWIMTTVGSVFEIVGGGTPDTRNPAFWEGQIPWVTSADLNSDGSMRHRRTIAAAGIEGSAASLVPASTVIVATRVGLGKVAVAPTEMAFSQDCQGLLPAPEVADAKFTFYQISYRANLLKFAGRGTTISGVPKAELLRLPFTLPALAEQQRIVSAIEEEFSRIDAGLTSLAEVEDRARVLRQAVLRAVLNGELMGADGRGWKSEPLGGLGVLDRGRSRHRPRNDPKLYGGRFPFVQTGDVTRANPWIERFSQTYNDEGLAQSRLWPSGTLCITIAANIAKTGLLRFDACFPDSVVGFIATAGPAMTRWVELVVRRVQAELEALAPATAQKNINLAVLRRVQVPQPPPGYVEQATAEHDRLVTLVDSVERCVAASRQRADGLRRSILAAAFQGRLLDRHIGGDAGGQSKNPQDRARGTTRVAPVAARQPSVRTNLAP